MAMHKCQCVQCRHEFYWVSVDCRQDDRVLCPVCRGPVEVGEMDLPKGKEWSVCPKNSCEGCSGNSGGD